MSKHDVEQARLDLNPHQEAVVAMVLYSERYSKQNRGCMGFYAQLNASQKRHVQEIAERIRKCPPESDYY